ncbi:MAG: CHASE2 domain-containing protein [Cyanothece sp. SIO2G6]|nr:CHASE2 domain-containing protein [Cyanothece sp. SIO2G6]
MTKLPKMLPRFRDLVMPLLRDRRVPASVVNMGQSVVLASLVTTGLVLGLRTIGIFERPELALYDQFMRLQGDRPPDNRIVVVGIDEVDLQTLQEWPLSDASLARLLASLQEYQPRVIGIDILRDIPTGPGRDALIEQLQQSNVLSVCKVNSTHNPGVPPPQELARESVVFSDLVVDPGGILRRSLLFLNPPPLPIPAATPNVCNTPETLTALSFGSVLKYLDAQDIANYSFDEKNQLRLGQTLLPPVTPNFGGYRGADAAGYQVMLRYRAEENSVPIVSLMDVIEGRVADERIRDRIVLIGYTTPLAKDDFYTPYSVGRDDQQKMPGVVIHAQATSQILDVVLDGRSLMRPWPLPLEILWIYGWSLAMGMFAWSVRHPAWFSSGLLLILGTAYSLSFLLFLHSAWIPVLPTLVSIVMTASGVVLVDRFSNSDYGKQVVKQVKTFLHIDIDQKKLDQQVSEITETDYFQDLKNTVKSLRSQSTNRQGGSGSAKSNLNSQSNSKITFVPKPDSSQDNQENSQRNSQEQGEESDRPDPVSPTSIETNTTTNGASDQGVESNHTTDPDELELGSPELDTSNPDSPDLDTSNPDSSDLDTSNPDSSDLDTSDPDNPDLDTSDPDNPDDDGLDFLADINQEAQRLKKKH